MIELMTTIEGCARCGEDHADLQFKRFDRPILDTRDDGTIFAVWDYWTLCPTSGDPVLLCSERMDDKEHEQ